MNCLDNTNCSQSPGKVETVLLPNKVKPQPLPLSTLLLLTNKDDSRIQGKQKHDFVYQSACTGMPVCGQIGDDLAIVLLSTLSITEQDISENPCVEFSSELY